MGRLILNRKYYHKQIHKIEPNYWDAKKSRVNKKFHAHVQLNQKLMDWEHRAEVYIIENNKINPNDFFLYLIDELPSIAKLSECLQEKIKTFHKSQTGTISKYEATINKVNDFNNIDVVDLDLAWIEQFDKHLKNGGAKINTRGKFHATIKAALNRYIKLDLISKNPYIHFAIKKERSAKVKMTASQFKKWNNYKTDIYSKRLAWNLFRFSFFMRGMRVGKILVLTPDDIINSHIVKRSSKTSKEPVIKINKIAQSIIDEYKGQSEYYLFPILKMAPEQLEQKPRVYKRKIDSGNSMVRKYLNEIAIELKLGFKIGMHTARHSFAFIADQSGVGVKDIQDLLDQSSLAVTEGYIRELNRDNRLDVLMDDIIDKLQ